MNWNACNSYCANLVSEDFDDWRLPSDTEMYGMWNGTSPYNGVPISGFGVAEQMVVQLISYINLVQVVHTLLNGMLKRIRLLVGVFGPYCSRDRGIERKSEKAAVREPCQVSI